jgi:hypothetical protein
MNEPLPLGKNVVFVVIVLSRSHRSGLRGTVQETAASADAPLGG